MARLVWDNVGDRRYEAGLDRGVLYSTDGVGIPWNGLTAVKDAPSGGEAKPFYLDGIKYLNVPGREDVGGTIEAFTYPDEFSIHDGSYIFTSGLITTQQRRKPFALSYRTKVGNDIDGSDHGYKIHIIYNALVDPTDRSYGTTGESISPLVFSWNFTTTPKKPVSDIPIAPLSHVIIDSTKTSPSVLRFIEEQLYGSIRAQAALIPMDELFAFFNDPVFIYSVFAHTDTGLAQLQLETDGTGDLIGSPDDGIYEALSESRLIATATPGIYTLGS